ncbi:MAG: MOSC domain-containing protein [Acidimicrobiales bacterium]
MFVSELCDRCGFVPADYSARDLATAPGWLGAMADQMLEPVPAAVLRDPVRADVGTLRATIASIDRDAPDPVVIHDAIHRLRDLGRSLHEVGAGAPSQEGTVTQLSASNGGVPKMPVLVTDVGPRGLLGDRQDNRTHHGRPFQALCLWSAEVIDALAAEGHPVRSGATGENVTVGGIDWSTLRPGVRLLVGQVSCEISAWATPCRKNDRWFTARSDRIDHALHPGWSRAYAWVLEPGTITTGDPVLVEP